MRGTAAAQEELLRIEAIQMLLASLHDPEAGGAGHVAGSVQGAPHSRLPEVDVGRRFCGSIMRWMPGTKEPPVDVLGHVGDAVVPWKKGRGYAKQALCDRGPGQGTGTGDIE